MKDKKQTVDQKAPPTPEAPAIPPAHKTERRSVRCPFTDQEKAELHKDLLESLGARDTAVADFEDVKQAHKARVTAAESRVVSVAASLRAGFQLKTMPCRIVWRPKDRKKDVYREDTGDLVATEDMTAEDMQADLLLAESAFDSRSTVELWPTAGNDRGEMALGAQRGRWFAALRLTIGGTQLSERLDSEQRSFKHRHDAVKATAERALDWILTNHGKQAREGFLRAIEAAVAAQKDKVE